jgi:hypothetical protein
MKNIFGYIILTKKEYNELLSKIPVGTIITKEIKSDGLWVKAKLNVEHPEYNEWRRKL